MSMTSAELQAWRDREREAVARINAHAALAPNPRDASENADTWFSSWQRLQAEHEATAARLHAERMAIVDAFRAAYEAAR